MFQEPDCSAVLCDCCAFMQCSEHARTLPQSILVRTALAKAPDVYSFPGSYIGYICLPPGRILTMDHPGGGND